MACVGDEVSAKETDAKSDKESKQQDAKVSDKESGKKSDQESGKVANKDGALESDVSTGEDSDEEGHKEASVIGNRERENGLECGKDCGKETGEEAAKETGEEGYMETGEEAAKETDEEAAKETGQEGSKNHIMDGGNDNDQEAAKVGDEEDSKERDQEGVRKDLQNVAYPGRLFPAGREPEQKRSMNRYCDLTNIGRLHEALGADVWRYISESSVGVIVKFVEREFTWSANQVHYLLVRQLKTNKQHEIWCLFDDQPIRFGLCEFRALTGMNTDPYEAAGEWDVDHSDFWNDMGVPLGDGPTWKELEAVLSRCRTWSFEKRCMVGLLSVLALGVLCLHHGSRIPLHLAKRVFNKEAFDKYPWGRKTCESLIRGIKEVNLATPYLIVGFVPILQVWLYESVPCIGTRYGGKIEDGEVPALSWLGGRPRFKFEDVIGQEKKKASNNKVSVRHMIFMRGEKALQPSWTDEVEDPSVDKLVDDCFYACISEDAWKTEVRRKRKRDGVSKSGNKKTITKPNNRAEDSDDDSVLQIEKDKSKKKMNKKKDSEKDGDFIEESHGSKPCKKLKKKIQSEDDDDFVQPNLPTKPKKKNNKHIDRAYSEDSVEEMHIEDKKMKRKVVEKSTRNCSGGSIVAADFPMSSLMHLIESLTTKVDSLDNHVKENTKTMTSIYADMEQRLSAMEDKVNGKLETVEKELELIRDTAKVATREVVQSTMHREDESVSKDPKIRRVI